MRFAEAARSGWGERLVERLIPDRPPSGRLRLGHRNLYILPTRFGLLWLAGTGLQLLLGIQSQQNGPLLLAGVMLALLLLALLLSHANLEGLELQALPRPQGVGFAGEPLQLTLLARSRMPREGLRLALAGQPLPPPRGLPAGETALLLPWRAQERGLQQPGRLKLISTAPLGLFVCWAHWRPDAPQLVFPARRPGPVSLVPATAASEALAASTAAAGQAEGSDQWLDLRPHRPQDSSSRLVWKLLAQGRGRLSKQLAAEQGAPKLWAPAPGLPGEAALEHLSAQVWQSAQRDEIYGLELPGCRIPPGRGRAHRDRCLAALAMAELPGV
jgi:uncharacterized protein (DUF58 family)